MTIFLRLAKAIDKLSRGVGIFIAGLILILVFFSAANAIARKAFSISSNGMLEIQWYLFSAVFLFGAGYALLRNAHVRVDFVANRLAPKTRALIDILGIILVITPFCFLVIWLSWPLVADAWLSGEKSPDAGGLIRWPVYALVPAGMVLLWLQAISELIKRMAFLKGIPGYGEAGSDAEQAEAQPEPETPPVTQQ